MAYSEFIKNFSKIRAYLRSFYVYGFRHRDEFTKKSARSYDNERRRVESWLGDYMSFGQDADGKRVFLSVDSRAIPENPLYRAFRTKSFTDRDITLHFHLLDLLKGTNGLSITEIMDELTDRLSAFANADLPDESTVRKKLREYASLGLVVVEKRGRETVSFKIREQLMTVLPLKVYIGTQTGRQYLLACPLTNDRFSFYRVDLMDQVKAGDIVTLPGDLTNRLNEFCSHAWGVTGNNGSRQEHLEMTVHVGPEEGFIVERLLREKRCGTVEQLDDTHWKFSADVYNTLEMLPCLRTFTGRVTELQCTDKLILTRFWGDFEELAKMYECMLS